MVTILTALTIQQHGDDEIKTCAGPVVMTQKEVDALPEWDG